MPEKSLFLNLMFFIAVYASVFIINKLLSTGSMTQNMGNFLLENDWTLVSS